MPRINGLAAGVPVSSYGANSNLNTNGGNRKQGLASTTNTRSQLFFPIRSRTHQSDPNYLLCNRTNVLSGGVGRRSGSFVPGAGGVGDVDTYGCWVQGLIEEKVRYCIDLRSRFAAYDAAQVAHVNDMISAYQNFAQAFQTHENAGITYSVALVGNRETLVTDGVRESIGGDLSDTIQHMAPGSTSPAWQYLTTTYANTSPSQAALLEQYADEVIALNIRGVIQEPTRAYSREAYQIHKNNSNYLQSLLMPHEIGLVPTNVESALKANGYGVNLKSVIPDFEKVMMYWRCFVYCPPPDPIADPEQRRQQELAKDLPDLENVIEYEFKKMFFSISGGEL